MRKSTSTTIRVTLGLVSTSLSLMLIASTLGLVPDDFGAQVRGRGKLCESLAICVTRFAEKNDVASIESCVHAIVQRNTDVKSILVKKQSGDVLIQSGVRHEVDAESNDEMSTETRMVVPVFSGSKPWGRVIIQFDPVRRHGLPNWLNLNFTLFLAFVLTGQMAIFSLYLRRVFIYLNPMQVVPGRVRSALDSLAEGLLLLNQDGRIVLANRAFASIAKRNAEELVGHNVEGLPWTRGGKKPQCDQETNDEPEPTESEWHTPAWLQTLRDGVPRFGEMLSLNGAAKRDSTFLVNAMPIRDDGGHQQGVLASFQDVTLLEERTTELQAAVAQLQESGEEIRRQNRDLEYMASHDALTGCWNRRSFLDRFDTLWSEALRDQLALSCTMVDVDHFKKINDTQGHLIGDQVLRQVAECLRTHVRAEDMVARYGGEEFTVLMPGTDVTEATELSERLRVAISQLEFPGFKVTASLGVSALSLDPESPKHLLDQADKCLYAAKRNGRNQVVRFDTAPPHLLHAEAASTSIAATPVAAESNAIPYHAVTALLTALAYHHPETAEHSRRVADLCVMVAEGMLSHSKCYVLEIAALLHDIGKIGIANTLLSKPGRLTTEELEAVRRHDQMSVEIIGAAFADRTMSAIVKLHNLPYQDSQGVTDVPLEARILAVADAYDVIISGGGYRPRRTTGEAVAELRRGAGTQFDPEVVEQFIAAINRRHSVSVSTDQLGVLTRETALALGLQIESLMTALDQQDMGRLKMLASDLKTRAQTRGVSAVATVAGDLERAVHEHDELIHVLRTTNELIALCRAAQQPFIQTALNSPR